MAINLCNNTFCSNTYFKNSDIELTASTIFLKKANFPSKKKSHTIPEHLFVMLKLNFLKNIKKISKKFNL